MYADGILTHVKRTKQIGKYTYYVGKIKGYNVIYDGVNYAHCTGACAVGTQQFIDGMGEIKDSYTIGEIIEMTKNEYGGEIFRKFFEVEQ